MPLGSAVNMGGEEAVVDGDSGDDESKVFIMGYAC